jgi:hypothetical protein
MPLGFRLSRKVVPAISLIAAAALGIAGCDKGSTAPVSGPPARLNTTSAASYVGPAGVAIPSPLTVHVADADGRPVAGATVTFAVTRGDGSVNPRIATTDANGDAKTTWTLGKVAGANEVVAMVEPLDAVIGFTATGQPGPVAGVIVNPKVVRFIETVSTISGVTARSVDQFGNTTTPPPAFTIKDPTLVSLDGTGVARVLRRGGTTYFVAVAGAFRDSAIVIVLAPGDSPCTGLSAAQTLAVGDVMTTGFENGGICIRGSGEFALVPFFNSLAPSAQIQIEATGFGVTAPGAFGSVAEETSTASMSTSSWTSGFFQDVVRDESVHDRLRQTEAREMPRRVASAREWLDERRAGAGRAAASAIPATLNVGDLVSLNVNDKSYCDSVIMRTGRVAAVTDRAVVVADTANPAGGFTDAEYAAIGAEFDTVNYAVDVLNFGEPSDIDGNKKVVMFFTSAVNALVPRTSTSVVLGFYYGRDLLPKTSAAGLCPGSNVGEMFYLLVPDPNGIVSGVRTKSQVATWTSGTVAHEFQHLINASRRLYVNNATYPEEERWLNEGLSHIAEELNFYRASGLQPHQNLGTVVSSAAVGPAFASYGRENFQRLRSYIAQTETQAPIGTNDSDDDLATRGATWMLLRYAADQLFAGSERSMWFNLANSKITGIENLNAVLGRDVKQIMREWTIAMLLDDVVAGTNVFRQPSWNLPQATPAATSLPYQITRSDRVLTNGAARSFILVANGVSYLRFGVAAGNDAYIVANTGGAPVPASVMLAVVRTK